MADQPPANQLEDCPTCPNRPLPSRTPILRPKIPDGLIPDTINLQPQVNIPKLAYVVAAIIALMVVVSMLGTALAGLAFGAYFLMRNQS